jgi:hypothetical protein
MWIRAVSNTAKERLIRLFSLIQKLKLFKSTDRVDPIKRGQKNLRYCPFETHSVDISTFTLYFTFFALLSLLPPHHPLLTSTGLYPSTVFYSSHSMALYPPTALYGPLRSSTILRPSIPLRPSTLPCP